MNVKVCITFQDFIYCPIFKKPICIVFALKKKNLGNVAPWSAQPQTMLLNLSFSSVDSWNPTSSKPTSQTFKKKKQWGWESGEAVALLYLFAIGSRFLFFFFSNYLCLDSVTIGWIGWIQTYGSEKIGLLFILSLHHPQNGLFSLMSHGSWVHSEYYLHWWNLENII